MADRLIEIAKTFRADLCGWYDESLRRGAPSEGRFWLKSAFVFISLEACRDLIGDL